MLNWNRTVLDSLAITFSPTCSSIVDAFDQTNAARPPPVGALQWTVKVPGRDAAPARIVTYTIQTPPWPTNVGPLPSADPAAPLPTIRVNERSADAQPIGTPGYGTIQWGGFAYPAVVGEVEQPTAGRIELRGAVTDPISGNSVGAVTLIREQDGSVSGHVTPDLFEALSDDQPTADYWASLQSCEVVTPSQKQAVAQHTQDVNNLLKLTTPERQRLLQ